MRSIFLRLALVLTAFVIAPDALAADTDSGNFFLDAKIGTVFGRQSDSVYANGGAHSSSGADGGYLWKVDDARSVGFEVGYMHFGIVDVSGGNFARSEASADAVSAGAHYEYLFGEDKTGIILARAGLMRVKFDQSFYTYVGPGTSGVNSSHATGRYFGLGIGRNLTQSLSLLLVYNYFGSDDAGGAPYVHQTGLDLNWIGLQAEYRF